MLMVIFCVIGISYTLHQIEAQENRSSGEENSTLSTIIGNVLIRYFSKKSIFVSMILSPTLDEQLLLKIFQSSFLNEFSYDVLDQLNTRINTPRDAINLIIVDDLKWFP